MGLSSLLSAVSRPLESALKYSPCQGVYYTIQVAPQLVVSWPFMYPRYRVVRPNVFKIKEGAISGI